MFLYTLPAQALHRPIRHPILRLAHAIAALGLGALLGIAQPAPAKAGACVKAAHWSDYPAESAIRRAADDIMARAGLCAEWQEVPSPRALQMVETGEIDVDFFRQPSAFADFSHIIPVHLPTPGLALVLLPAPQITAPFTSVEDFPGKRFSVLRSYSALSSQISLEGLSITGVDTLAQGEAMLRHGRADGFFVASAAYIEMQRLGMLEGANYRSPVVIAEMNENILVHDSRPDLVEPLRKAGLAFIEAGALGLLPGAGVTGTTENRTDEPQNQPGG